MTAGCCGKLPCVQAWNASGSCSQLSCNYVHPFMGPSWLRLSLSQHLSQATPQNSLPSASYSGSLTVTQWTNDHLSQQTVLLYLTSMRFLKVLNMISLRRTYSPKYHRLHHSLLPSRQPTQILKALEEGKALSSYLPIPLSNQRYLASISFLRDDLNLWLMGIHVPIAKEGLLFIYKIFAF